MELIGSATQPTAPWGTTSTAWVTVLFQKCCTTTGRAVISGLLLWLWPSPSVGLEQTLSTWASGMKASASSSALGAWEYGRCWTSCSLLITLGKAAYCSDFSFLRWSYWTRNFISPFQTYFSGSLGERCNYLIKFLREFLQNTGALRK